MTWWHYPLLFFAGLPMALFFAYSIGIQYERESLPGWQRDFCYAIAGLAYVIDVPTNWLVFSIFFWEIPESGERTLSDRLERLCLENGWRSRMAWRLGRLLNWIAPPGHPHIKNAVEPLPNA